MALSGDRFRQLQTALLSAFPDYAGLAQMVRVRLNVNLHEIALPDNMRTVTYKLIDWADRTGRLHDLIQGALAENPGNPELAAIAATLDAVPAPAAAVLKVSLAKMPSTHPDLFGRERELALLDAAWGTPSAHPITGPEPVEGPGLVQGTADTPSNQKINVVEFVAWGGVGKTALVNKWLNRLAADHYRGATRVYGWSFYSQGAAEGRQASADPFIAAALRWFGDPEPDAGSLWDKGERLAELVRAGRTLLVLDGLEPLQYPPGEMGGRLRDPGMASLLCELARYHPGLCVVTTRLAADELRDCEGDTVHRIELEALSPEAGEALLRKLGVQGTADELRAAVTEYGGHALALTLLGGLLRDACDGDVRRRREVGPLAGDVSGGGHARQVMASYEKWFGPGLEQAILRLMGLFDRPAEGGALAALRASPPIPGLTDALFRGEPPVKGLRVLFRTPKPPAPIPDVEWNRAVIRLRHARLLDERDPVDPDALDAHPLVREHFGEQLRQANPAAWREAHGRLYKYYKGRAPKYPDTLDAMAPLYAAVVHGCAAGQHDRTYVEVYFWRINRRNARFAVTKLGAFGEDLAALAGFFDADAPWRRVVIGPRREWFRERCRAYLLNAASVDLRALGRLAEAMESEAASLEINIAQKNWRNAFGNAANLSQLALATGDLPAAIRYAGQSIELANRSFEPFLRVVVAVGLGDALHQAGRIDEAAVCFQKAEERQRVWWPEYPFFFSLQGYMYSDLLLAQGQAEEVLLRVGQTLKWAEQHGSLLAIALDHLSRGRAYLVLALAPTANAIARSVERDEAIPSESSGLLRRAMARDDDALARAAVELDHAVAGLWQAGYHEFISRGLLARAALRRVTGEFDRARRDLDEALVIATRGGMRLHEADCHLEYARLFLAMGDAAQAQEHFAVAKRMVSEMGYGRRAREVQELEAALGAQGI